MKEFRLPFIRPAYPQNFLEGDLQGNIQFPQIHAAQPILGGVHVVQNIIEGKLTWDQFLEADLNMSQMRAVRKKTFRIHNAYGVPLIPERISRKLRRKFITRHPNFNPEWLKNNMIKDEDLRGIIRADKDRVIRTATNYARLVIPKEQQPESVIPDRLKSKLPQHAEDRYNIPLLNLLFTDPTYKKEAETIVEIWQVAAATLQTDEARRIGKDLRESLRGGRRINSLTNSTINDLYTLVQTTLTEQFPDVSQNVIREFVSDTIVRKMLSTDKE